MSCGANPTYSAQHHVAVGNPCSWGIGKHHAQWMLMAYLRVDVVCHAMAAVATVLTNIVAVVQLLPAAWALAPSSAQLDLSGVRGVGLQHDDSGPAVVVKS